MKRHPGSWWRLWLVALWVALPAAGAFMPDQIGDFVKKSSQPFRPADAALWEEYGFDEAEVARYEKPGGAALTATCYRLEDSTGGYAIFHLLSPPAAEPINLAPLAVRTAKGALVAIGNYVFDLEGALPDAAQLQRMAHFLPRTERSPLPVLGEHMRKDSLIAGSRRYILGPVSLERFEPRIPPSVAGFRFGAEAELGRFRGSNGEMKLLVFSYPTPHIAREKLEEFGRISRAMVKRTGPLLAVIIDPADPDDAERLLARVNYEATISWSEHVPTERDDPIKLILAIFSLIGVLLLIALGIGLGFGGFRVLYARITGKDLDKESEMVTLRIDR